MQSVIAARLETDRRTRSWHPFVNHFSPNSRFKNRLAPIPIMFLTAGQKFSPKLLALVCESSWQVVATIWNPSATLHQLRNAPNLRCLSSISENCSPSI